MIDCIAIFFINGHSFIFHTSCFAPIASREGWCSQENSLNPPHDIYEASLQSTNYLDQQVSENIRIKPYCFIVIYIFLFNFVTYLSLCLQVVAPPACKGHVFQDVGRGQKNSRNYFKDFNVEIIAKNHPLAYFRLPQNIEPSSVNIINFKKTLLLSILIYLSFYVCLAIYLFINLSACTSTFFYITICQSTFLFIHLFYLLYC